MRTLVLVMCLLESMFLFNVLEKGAHINRILSNNYIETNMSQMQL